MRPLRTALVGFGKIADSLSEDPRMAKYFKYAVHAQVLAEHPAFEWLAVVDRSSSALIRAADRWGIGFCSEELDAVESEIAPEVAVIATPPNDRMQILDAFRNLKAIFLEKPLGQNGAEARAFIAECERRGILVQVNYWRRGVPRLRDLAEGQLTERIGSVQTAFATYGGGLHNNGSHLVDLVRMLLGPVQAVRALAPPTMPSSLPLPGDVLLPFALSLASGPLVMVSHLDFLHFREVGLDVWGCVGRLELLQETLTETWSPRKDNRGLLDAFEIASDTREVADVDVSGALYQMYSDLADAVEGEGPPTSSGASAIENETIIDGLLESAARNGVAVEV